MPPKVRFTREQIVDAAFRIACKEGMEGITIRGIAATLGCSIAPIYVNFSRIDDVRQAVAERAIDESRRILAEVNTDNPFRDIGTASVRFARDYPVIFRDLVLTPNEYMPAQSKELDPHLVSHMKEDPDLAGLSTDDLQRLLLKMRLFHTGFAAAVANGLLPGETGEEDIIELMSEVAGDLVSGARVRAKHR
ncbi:MAG: TetR/AcrR family transcriptional regulator [Spirochaetaceae bacterium]|nr:MAG: TetR/AcrR family transcriptional regulator [Spirochaetaceae bacterium]